MEIHQLMEWAREPAFYAAGGRIGAVTEDPDDPGRPMWKEPGWLVAVEGKARHIPTGRILRPGQAAYFGPGEGWNLEAIENFRFWHFRVALEDDAGPADGGQ